MTWLHPGQLHSNAPVPVPVPNCSQFSSQKTCSGSLTHHARHRQHGGSVAPLAALHRTAAGAARQSLSRGREAIKRFPSSLNRAESPTTLDSRPWGSHLCIPFSFLALIESLTSPLL